MKGFIGGQLRKAGDEFECTDKAFSDKWMEKVKAKGKQPKAKPVEESEVKAYNIPSEAISSFQLTELDM